MSDHFASADGLAPRPTDIRNPLAEYRKALEAKVELYRSIGQPPGEFLLGLLAELDEREGRDAEPQGEPAPEPEVEPEFEHAAADAPPENTARRGPGRPRKPTDVDRAPSSE